MNVDQIICGDCVEVMHGMDVESVDLILADPPYGIDYQSAWRIDKTQWKPKILNDKEPFLDWVKFAYRVLRSDGALICFCRWDVEEIFKQTLVNNEFVVKSQVIWDRVSHGMGDLNGSFAPQHENMWFAVKGNFDFFGARPKSIIREPRVPAEQLTHPNEKPVRLYNKLILPLTKKSDVVLDPFTGSGASLQSAKQLGRHYIGIDISPEYCKLAERRVLGANVPLPGLV